MLKLRRGRLVLVAAIAALSVIGVSTAASAHINPFSPGHTLSHVGDVVELVCDNDGVTGDVCEGTSFLVGSAFIGLAHVVGSALFGLGHLVGSALFGVYSLLGSVWDGVGFSPFDVIEIVL